MILFLFNTSLMAQKVSLEGCIQDGEDYKGKNLVDKKCFELIFNHAPEKSRDEITDVKGKKFKVTALKNLLYIQIEGLDKIQKQNLISGEKSGLHEILSVSLSPYSNMVAVLNKNNLGRQEIRVFDRSMSGNVVPSHYFDMDEIQTASAIFYHSDNKEIWFTRGDGIVSAVHSEADSRMPHKKPAILVSLNFKDITGKQPLTLAFVKKHLLVLSADGNNLYAFQEPLEKKTQADQNFAIPSSAPKELNTLRYIKSKDLILLLNNESEILEIPFKLNIE
ncbi:MAG: hypothetical protein JNM93_03065 [Bacteriovoracaceae bacterium]|nr:hypothetical protein [Bacteriovoracaceae bacterium]